MVYRGDGELIARRCLCGQLAGSPLLSSLRVYLSVSYLGSPVVPFCPFCLGVSLLKPNIRKKGTLIIKGLLGNLVLVGL